MKRLGTLLQRLQVFAWLEPDGLSGGNVDFGSRSRVSPDACLSRFHREYSESAKFNPIVGFQSVLHTIEDRIDCLLGFCFADACSFDDLIYKIKLDHAKPPRFAISFRLYIFNTLKGI
jgi:hypothetical protein